MRRLRLAAAGAAAASALLLLLALVAVQTRGDDIDSRIYTNYLNDGYCVRLTHQTGAIGCATPKDGVRGKLRLALDDAALDALVASPPSYRVALVLPVTLLRARTLQLLTGTPGLRMAGVMVLPADKDAGSIAPTPLPGGYSHAPRAPQLLPYIPEQAAIPERPGRPSPFNNSYEWNPAGDGATLMRFDMAIVTLIPSEQAHVLALAQANEQHEAGDKFVEHVAEFNYHMYAKDNTVRCLKDATCMPVGGYSVWGSLGNMTHNSTTAPVSLSDLRPIVLAAAKMDSNAFFHQLSPGADESMAGVAVLAAALQALANAPGIASLPSQILFGVFNGESWSHVGSRKFVDDIQHFQCDNPNPAGGDPANPACFAPYKNNLAFQDVRLEKIDKIVEVGQIGLNSTVFLHRQRDGNPVTDQMIETIRNAAANLSTPIAVSLADADTPGIPPSCSEAFLSARSDIGVVVLSDHAGPFANQYLHSQYDSALNVQSEWVPGSAAPAHPQLCNKATLLARTLWLEAGGDDQSSLALAADCRLIEQLLRCLLENADCDLVRQWASWAYGRPPAWQPVPSHYVGVYQLVQEQYIADTPLFLHNLLQGLVLNATGHAPAPPGSPSPVTVHYHDAVDPNLVFSLSANRWHIRADANDFPLWAESNWDNGVGFRTFRVEDPQTEVVAFVVGIAVLVASVVGVGAARKYCNRRFKSL